MVVCTHAHTHSETPTCTHTQCPQACMIVISVQRGKTGSWGKIKWCYGSMCQVGLAPPESWTANCHATARGDHSPQSAFYSSAPSFEKQLSKTGPRSPEHVPVVPPLQFVIKNPAVAHGTMLQEQLWGNMGTFWSPQPSSKPFSFSLC